MESGTMKTAREGLGGALSEAGRERSGEEKLCGFGCENCRKTSHYLRTNFGGYTDIDA